MTENDNTTINEFATQVVKALRQLGDKTHWRFDPRTVWLFPKPEEGNTSDISYRINPSNHHREWQMLEINDRAEFIKKYAEKILQRTFVEDLKPTQSEITSKLMLSIRSVADRDQAMTMMDEESDSLIFKHLVDGLEACVMIDGEKNMRRLTTSDLKNYRLTENDAFAIATKNLLDRSQKPMANMGNGLFVSDWNDDYDSARILLPDLLKAHLTSGALIAFAPTRNKLLITSDQSDSGLAAMMRIVEAQRGQPRSIPPRMLIHENGAWRQYNPARYATQLSHLQTDFEADEYGIQKTMLEEKLKRHQRDIFVASYKVFDIPQNQTAMSACTWTKGVPTLLPRADLICLMDLDKPNETVVLSLRDAIRIIGPLISRTENPLIRLFVEEFPNESQLAELRQHAFRR